MRDDNCIFCKIAAGDIPSYTLYEDPDFRVILDLGPASRGHALILPKDHWRDLGELPDEAAALVLPLARRVGTALKDALGADGFNVIQNNGAAAGQTVPHFHVHLIPRYEGGPRIAAWDPGKLDADEALDIISRVENKL